MKLPAERSAGRAVVIGSGMAGLTAAVLLQSHGWQVDVLERHHRPGGFLHRFFRRAVPFDTGFHYVGSAAPDQTFGRAMRHLGVYDRVRWVPLDPDGFDVLRFPDLEFAVPAGLDRWAARLGDLFPDERAGIARYLDVHRAAVRDYGWFHFDPSVPPEAVLPWEERSLQSVLDDCFRDPRLKMVVAGQAALYGVPPKEAPFGLHAIVTDHFSQGAWTIDGGGDRLAFALAGRLRELGGRVHLKTPVAAVDVQGGVATAVVAEDGRRFDADLVIAAVHPRIVLGLLPEGTVRPAYATRVREARAGRAHVGVYLRAKGLGALAGRNHYRFRSWDMDVLTGASNADAIPMYFLAAPGLRGGSRVDAARDAAVAVLAADWSAWAQWDGDSPRAPAYLRAKAAVLERFLAALREDFPGVDVSWAEASTPLSTRRFTGAVEGAMYGHYHSVEQMGRYRFPMLTRVKGLVQIGQAVAFPGICGAMMSAYVGLSRLLGEDALMQEIGAS